MPEDTLTLSNVSRDTRKANNNIRTIEVDPIPPIPYLFPAEAPR